MLSSVPKEESLSWLGAIVIFPLKDIECVFDAVQMMIPFAIHLNDRALDYIFI